MTGIVDKWRPSMALVVGLVCLVLVSAPVLAFLSMRLTSNQFVRETEQSLIHQAAIYAEIYSELFALEGGSPIGSELAEQQSEFWAAPLHPSRPSLNLRRSAILPPLPELEEPSRERIAAPDPIYQTIAPELLELARAARRTTLAGAIFLDHRGINLRSDQRIDLSAEPEVRAALAGRVGTALRDRGDAYERHPLTSISRDTWYRVFVAYPALLENRVIGVVYLSRTPSDVSKFVVTEWRALAGMLAATLLSAVVVGALLLRLILRPVRALGAQSQKIAHGGSAGTEPLQHYGIRELAELGQSVMRMSKTLTDRSRQISTYTDHVTHELKSPVTAIVGAAELLNGDGLRPEDRRTLQDNIEAQGRRMNLLLEKLREMTRLRDMPTTGSGPIQDVLPDIPGLDVVVDRESADVIPMLPEHARIVLHQLGQNAREAGATELFISFRNKTMTVRDDGRGIDPVDLDSVALPFFTTRRDEGGTGLGLAIANAILQNYGATLTFEPVETGALVRIVFAAL
ncbi:MAG: ATP-binding protein [Pseudomonadota bacterium]